MKLNSQLNSETASKQVPQHLGNALSLVRPSILLTLTALLTILAPPRMAGAETPVPITAPSGSAAPQWEQKESVVHRTSHQLTVELNEQTVVCSRAEYTRGVLKVLIPELSEITLLNHQNTGAGAPCMTTGETCGIWPDLKNSRTAIDRIDGGPGTESVVVEVTEKRVLTIDHKAKTCEVSLFEELEMNLRGKRWFHVVDAPLGQRPYNDCL